MAASRAYLDALRMLARRELSEAQVRQRLARREYDDDAVDEAIARLKEERAIDDVRVAEAIARTEMSLRKRGKLRVKRKIESAGIDGSIAKRVTDETFADVDSEILLQAALGRRLRDNTAIQDARTFNRLYRYLISQGFESDRVLAALKRRR